MERSFRAREATSAELGPTVRETVARTGKPLCFSTGTGRELVEATTTGAVLSSERRRRVTVDVSGVEEELRRYPEPGRNRANPAITWRAVEMKIS